MGLAVYVLTLLAALGAGMIAGVFFAFSVFVMRALAQLPAPHGVAAMQSINVVVVRSLFLPVFLGTALCCAVLTAWWFVDPPAAVGLWLPIGGLSYLLGVFGVTMAFNVPLNNALARTTPTAGAGDAVWQDYLRRWGRWNHVRTVASLAAALVLTVGLTRLA